MTDAAYLEFLASYEAALEVAKRSLTIAREWPTRIMTTATP